MSYLIRNSWGILIVAGMLAVLPTSAQNADTPLPLELRVPSKVTLDENESAYFKIALPADDIRVILDTRRADEKNGNLLSNLSILDRDGGVVQNGAIMFNQIDVSWRKVAYFTLKKPTTLGFKVTNTNAKAHFWVSVSRKSDLPLIPMYGSIIHTPIVPGEGKTALLREGEDAYYVTALPKGEYRAVAELANAQKQNGNIQGYFAFLDQDGGNQQGLVGFNEIDVSFRKTGGFTVLNTATFIFRIHNSGSANMNSLVRISPAE